jgi:hypothetical protein
MASNRPDRFPPSDGSESTRTAGERAGGSTTDAARRQWGDLRLLNELGRGGFGRVYRAWDDGLAREVALKITRPRDLSNLASALREGQMLARVRHRNVVTVYGVRQVGDEIGLTMELIAGESLSAVVRRSGPMGAEEASLVGISVCHALAAVHAAGLLHRDIKAHNVMRESGGRIVLMDFGAGLEREPRTPPSSRVTGTPLYLAPELLEGDGASTASDIYSLGVLLFFLVTCQYPVDGETIAELARNHAHGKRKLLLDCRPDLPDGFARVVEQAISERPERRGRTAGALLTQLTEAMPGISRRWVDGAEGPASVMTPERTPASVSATIPQAALQSAMVAAFTKPALWLFGIMAGIGFLGFLSSVVLDQALGRAHGFADNSIWSWWASGLQALIPSVIYAGLGWLAVRIVVAFWQLVARAVPPIQRATERGLMTISSTFARVSAGDANVAARFLLLAQVLLVAAVVFVFRDVLHAMMVVNDADRPLVAALNHDGRLIFFYQLAMSLVVAVTMVGWLRLLARHATRHEIDRTTGAAGVALTILALLLLVAPHRLLYQSQFPRMDAGAERCYQTGARGDEVLLFCPDSTPPRIKTRSRGDRNLHPGDVEWIFSSTPASAASR